MTKHEYLTALDHALRRLSAAEREAALSFCEEMIDERIESGFTEEAAVAAMDEPAKMAEKLAMDIKQSAREAAAPIQTSANDAAAPSQPLTNEWQKMILRCDGKSLNHIDLQTRNMPITVRPAKDSQVTLTYFTRLKNVHEAKVEGDTLTLREVSKEEFHLFNFFSPSFSREGVTLEVPADLMVNLHLQTKNAPLTLQDLGMLMHVSLQTSNGPLTLHNIRCISLSAKTSNGPMKLQDVQAKQGVEATTSNGSMTAWRCRCPGDFTLHTPNGPVKAEECTSGGHLSLTASNGPIKVYQVDGAGMTLATSNAPIAGNLPGPQSRWQISSRTSNGHNSLPFEQMGEKPLSVHTSNASIKINFT